MEIILFTYLYFFIRSTNVNVGVVSHDFTLLLSRDLIFAILEMQKAI